jgi:hypothetical protein
MQYTFGSLLHSYSGFTNANENGCTIVHNWRLSHPNAFTVTFTYQKTGPLICKKRLHFSQMLLAT